MEQASILIVDDNPEIREIIQILLSGEGFQVQEAANGTQALNLIKETPFDLIILDIMMPGLNGYHFFSCECAATKMAPDDTTIDQMPFFIFHTL